MPTTFPSVPSPDGDVLTRAVEATLQRPLMPAQLGSMDEIAAWLASCQGVWPPKDISYPQLHLFAGDQGISSLSCEDEVQALATHTHPTSCLAQSRGVQVVVHRPTAGRSGHIGRQDAMDTATCQESIECGRTAADRAIDQGADVLLVGTVSPGLTMVAAGLMAAVGRREPVVMVPRDCPVDEWKAAVTIIRDARFRLRNVTEDPAALMQVAGSPELAAAAGFCAQAAVRRTPVVLDGATGATAGVVANMFAPTARNWFIPACSSPWMAQDAALERLGLAPILDVNIEAESGVGAVLAVDCVRQAATLAHALCDAGER